MLKKSQKQAHHSRVKAEGKIRKNVAKGFHNRHNKCSICKEKLIGHDHNLINKLKEEFKEELEVSMVGSHLTEHDLLVLQHGGGINIKAWKEEQAKKKRAEFKERREVEEAKAKAAIEELRIFECGHGYHKKCIDEA